MNILITGGTGFIGRALIASLQSEHTIYCLTRRSSRVRDRFGDAVIAVESYGQLGDTQIDAVVNLAGAGIADARWSESRKALLRSSRIDGTRQLVEWIGRQSTPPSVLISGSAIGFYGDHPGDEPLSEEASVIEGFTHQLCQDWEQAALEAEQHGVRVCLIRTGVVLGTGGGALARMLLPFRLGLGGPVGSGQQWMSWVHIDDEVAAIRYLLTSEEARGAFNLTAPQAVTNRDFSTALGKALRRPAFMPLPPFVVRLMLGEGAELLLGGQRVYPKRLEQAGFEFRYPQLDDALASVV